MDGRRFKVFVFRRACLALGTVLAVAIAYGGAGRAQPRPIVGPAVPDSAAAAPHSGPADRCWTPEAIAAKPGENKARKYVPAAHVDPPVLDSQPVHRPAAPVGVVRRVALPPSAGKLIALTFDLCEEPYEIAGYDGAIVDYLRQEQVHATFFAGGKWLLTHKPRAEQLMADPLFEVGNHTWEHRNLRLLAGAELDQEIMAPEAAYESVRSRLSETQCLDRTGERPAVDRVPPGLALLRFPFGACNPAALEAVARNGLTAIQWDVSSGDPSPAESAPHMAAALVGSVRPGSIVVFHANGRGWHTAEALRLVIPALRAKGYAFVTVGDLLRVPGAKWDVRTSCFNVRPGDTDQYDRFAQRLEAAYQQFRFHTAKSAAKATPRPARLDNRDLVPSDR